MYAESLDIYFRIRFFHREKNPHHLPTFHYKARKPTKYCIFSGIYIDSPCCEYKL